MCSLELGKLMSSSLQIARATVAMHSTIVGRGGEVSFAAVAHHPYNTVLVLVIVVVSIINILVVVINTITIILVSTLVSS